MSAIVGCHALTHWLKVIAAASASLILVLLILITGRQQFPGMDGGVLASAAWQSQLGYRPYIDVITAVPPVFMLGARFALALFGVRWLSFVWITAILSLVTYPLHIVLLRRAGLTMLSATAVAILTQLCVTVPGGFWWYNMITEILACLFLAAFAGWRRRSRFDAAAVLFGALLLLSKPNVGIPLLSLTCAFAVFTHNWRKALIAYASMAALASAILFAAQISPGAILWNYKIAGSRAFSPTAIARFLMLNQPWEVLQTTLLLIPGFLGLAVLAIVATNWRIDERGLNLNLQIDSKTSEHLAILAIGVLCAFIAMATNNSLNYTELPLAFCGVALCLNQRFRFATASTWQKAAIIGVVLTTVGLAANATRIATGRLLIRECGEDRFYQAAPLKEVSSPLFFSGVKGSPALHAVLQDLNQIFPQCSNCPERDGRVFIGPRIDFAYAAYHIKPYRGLPLWWEPFEDPVRPATREMVARFQSAHFQLAVFLKNDFTFLPDAVTTYLKSEYEVSTTETLTVFRARKTEIGALRAPISTPNSLLTAYAQDARP